MSSDDDIFAKCVKGVEQGVKDTCESVSEAACTAVRESAKITGEFVSGAASAVEEGVRGACDFMSNTADGVFRAFDGLFGDRK